MTEGGSAARMAPDRVDPDAWFTTLRSLTASLTISREATWSLGGHPIWIGATSDAAAAVALDGLVLARDLTGAAPAPSPRWLAIDGRRQPLPPPPFDVRDVRPRDGVAGFTAGRYRIAWAIEREVLWALDLESGDGVLWMRDPDRCAPWDRSAPWRPHASWWLADRRAGLVHAAAVAPPDHPDRGLLLVGVGGSGKSTLSLACAAAGWTIAADDYVVVGEDGGAWRASAPYRWAKADPTTVDLLAIPDAWLVPGVDHLGKALVDLPTAFAERGARSMELAAVVAPRIGAVTGEPVAARPAAMVAALGPSTVLQTPGDASAQLRVIGDLATGLPAWTVEVGPDVARSGPPALWGIVDRCEGRP